MIPPSKVKFKDGGDGYAEMKQKSLLVSPYLAFNPHSFGEPVHAERYYPFSHTVQGSNKHELLWSSYLERENSFNSELQLCRKGKRVPQAS